MIKKLFLMLVITMITVPVIAQDEVFVRFDVDEITGNSLIGTALSPDGTKIVGAGNDELCIVDLGAAASECVPFPEDTRLSSANYFAWSPDNTKVVFHAEFFRFLHEPDLWQYDLETQTFTILTPDDVDDVLQGRQEALLDVFPIYNPVDEMLYFTRIQETAPGRLVTVQRITSEGDLEQVAILPADFFFGFVPTGHPVFSPDSTQMAISINDRGDIEEQRGVWIITLADGSLEQITLPDSFPGVPSDITDDLMRPTELLWHRDDTLMLTVLDSASFNTLYYELMLDGTLIPLFDLSAMNTGELFSAAEPVTELSYSEVLPRDAVVSADGTRLYYAVSSNDEAEISVLSLSLPPNESSLQIEITERLNIFPGQQDFLRQAATNGLGIIWQNYVIAIGE
ncbi:MAG: hypothetical protein ACPG7F_04090 [Aggregatilineales bacterium]